MYCNSSTFHNDSGMSSANWAIASSKIPLACSISCNELSNSAYLIHVQQFPGIQLIYFSQSFRQQSMFPSCISISMYFLNIWQLKHISKMELVQYQHKSSYALALPFTGRETLTKFYLVFGRFSNCIAKDLPCTLKIELSDFKLGSKEPYFCKRKFLMRNQIKTLPGKK